MRNKTILLGVAVLLAILVSAPLLVAHAFSIVPQFPDTSATSAFTQTINVGIKTVDIVASGSYASVTSPSVALGAVTFGFNCQTTTGTFGTVTEMIYVKNPDAADGGWSVGLAAANPNALWVSSVSFDFNDPTTAGCTDGADATDTRPGQMTVSPNLGTLSTGACLSCTTTGVTLGSSTGFNQGTVDSIAIVVGAANSNDIGDWRVIGVGISQTIPPEQRAASDYTISLVLTIT